MKQFMKKSLLPALLGTALTFGMVAPSQAALQSRFSAITFNPVVDGGDYFTVYGSQNLKAWQGTLGFHFDYANRPLQFVGTGVLAGQRQSVIDHLMVANLHGALGFTDWFEAGINIPVVAYNWYFTDTAPGNKDHGGGMGDITLVTKFRLINTENSKVGLAFAPFATLPSGDTDRYTGVGHVQGGAKVITDVVFNDRFSMALNAGAILRDEVTRFNVNIDHGITYGAAANFKFTKNFQAIAEAFGTTNLKDPFGESDETPFEAGGGLRYKFADTGFAADLGGTGGIIDGVGSPRYRIFTGLTWTSPGSKCVAAPTPPPDPRIKGDKIVIWGKIFFDTDKATIKPISFPVLDDVVDVMNKNPHLTLVEVQGHADIRGSDNYNLRLSQRRAESVKSYLISKGINASRLTAKGYGESKPIAESTTREGLSQNRRVEFVILQSGK